MEHSEEIARMDNRVETIKDRMAFIIAALQQEFGDELVCYAMFELLTEELPYADPTEIDARHKFIVECLHECIEKAFADKKAGEWHVDDDSAVS